MNYCDKCMLPMDGRTVCPVCGVLPAAPIHHLSAGTVLQEKYLIGRALREDGGGITYIARDLSADEIVLVREFYPAELAQRDNTVSNAVGGMQNKERAVNRFAEKARLLAEFRNEPCVAAVHGSFRQNQTAYMVMGRPGGLSLQTFVFKKGPVPLAGLLEVIKPLLHTLNQIHRKGLLHRNISPACLRIYADGTVKLVGFGSVSGTLDENSLEPNYVPVELYGLDRNIGPWSDVYAICASIYTCITGVVPQLSVERAAQDQLRRPSEYGVLITAKQEDALMRGLAVWPGDRIQSVAQLLDALDLADFTQEPSMPAFTEENAEQEEMPEQQTEAPRWERVEDPALWEGMPSVTDIPAFLDPVSIQGKTYAEPVVTVGDGEEKNTVFPTFDPVAVMEEEPMEELAAEEEAPAEEPAETPIEETQEPEENHEPIPWEEPVPEWQGDYSPVEPIDPKFWQKELGIKEPEEPFPWEETPAAWQEPAQESEEQKIWPGIPEEETEEAVLVEEEPVRKKRRVVVLVAAALVALLSIGAVLLALFSERKTMTDDQLTLSISIDGQVYDLPCPVKKLNENGWHCIRLNGKTMIAGGNVLQLDMEKSGSIKAQITNPSNDVSPLEDCTVTGVIISDPSVDLDIDGIDLQTTPDAVTEQLGKPAEKEKDAMVYYDAEGNEWIFKLTDEGTLKSIGFYTVKK